MLVTTLKTLSAIALMSLVIPLYLWGATGNLRASLGAWAQWWAIVGGAAVIVGAVGLLAFGVELIG